MVELGKVDSAAGEKDMPTPDSQRSCLPTLASDEETKAAAQTLELLKGHQETASLPENTNLSTPPGEAKYFKGEGLKEAI